jgi:uncharacterized membrane protein YeaQ/YmgE (transglycosylase-associated protein family)
MDGLEEVATISNLGIGIAGWIVVGVIAGWLGHIFTHGASDTRVVHAVLGVVGAMVGGGMFGLLETGTAGLWGSLVVAFVLGLAFAWIVAIGSEPPAR